MAIAKEVSEYQRIARLFGGASVLKCQPETEMEVHDLLVSGLPKKGLDKFLNKLLVLLATDMANDVMGISRSTLRRWKKEKSGTLSPAQSGLVWKAAEILVRAMAIFGTQEKAENWLQSPAIGLDRKRPVALMKTPVGMELVEDYLGRIEHGVYT